MSRWNARPANTSPSSPRMSAHRDMTCSCRSGARLRVRQHLFRRWLPFPQVSLRASIPCSLHTAATTVRAWHGWHRMCGLTLSILEARTPRMCQREAMPTRMSGKTSRLPSRVPSLNLVCADSFTMRCPNGASMAATSCAARIH
jgi:hypothetical protein